MVFYMAEPLTISLDAMGGDHGPEVVLAGANISLSRHPEMRFRIYGDSSQIETELQKFPKLIAQSVVCHTDVAVPMDAKPSQALRSGRRVSSMWQAIEAVKNGEASAAISAGNTGALMAMSRFCLKMLPDINMDRPAIAAFWPTVTSECIVMDVGANVGADTTQLVDFALMGSAMARSLYGVERPKVGLLNIGEEEVKGLDEIKEAHVILRDSSFPMDYIGFVEGHKIGHDIANVVVCEGFSGNIALKTAEGTAKQVGEYVRSAINSSLISKIGALIARGAFQVLKEKMDPRNLNGGIFLGLNGIVIKSHGGMDAYGFANAIDVGYDMAKAEVVTLIKHDLELFHHENKKA